LVDHLLSVKTAHIAGKHHINLQAEHVCSMLTAFSLQGPP